MIQPNTPSHRILNRVHQRVGSSDLKKNYDWSIVFFKFIATFFVLNSHMGICYPKFTFLATGGAIGNSLFFFASGFTLFLSRPLNFAEYYKRRINRIYPVVVAMALVACIIWNSQLNFTQALSCHWFINCIMGYYAILWICRRLRFKMWYVIIFSILISVVILLTTFDFSSGIIYSDKRLRFIFYFPFMAMGALMGMNKDKFKYQSWHLIILFGSVLMWYFFNTFRFWLQLGSYFMLFPMLWSLYIIGKSQGISFLSSNRFTKNIIKFCGGLCLEVYLIQFSLITDKFNFIFPFNIPLVMAIVILAAYLLHILGNLIAQTFTHENYNIKTMIKV